MFLPVLLMLLLLISPAFGKEQAIPVDFFKYENEDSLKEAWIPVTSEGGEIQFQIEAGRTEGAKSLLIQSSVPVPPEGPRYEQIMRIFKTPQDWSASTRLEIWVKTDERNAAPWGGEFSFCLVDAEGQVWQNTCWLDRKTRGWQKFSFQLTAPPEKEKVQQNPWDVKPTVEKESVRTSSFPYFVIPPWEKVITGKLEKSKIRELWIKSYTTDEWVRQGYHSFTIYVADIVRIEPVKN